MACETILVVDDNTVNLKLTDVLLRNAGYTVRAAPDAETALEMLRTLRPDLMLVDIQLPGMNGLELAQRLKADETTRGIVLVALTAFAMAGDEKRVRDAGCDGYISKPIDTRALPRRIREFLDVRQTSVGPRGCPELQPVR
jgi:CheY-like chemotaxis protein